MLHLHHSNNLSTLGDRLGQQLQDKGVSALQSTIILVQNPGMKRWLQQRIAQQTGICANIDFPLPSRFVWDTYQAELGGAGKQHEYDAEVMRWRLLTLLRRDANADELSEIGAYLGQDRHGLAALQLADRLATLFDQYQVYRPDLILGWNKGIPVNEPDQAWQAWLWRQLASNHNVLDRSSMLDRLLHHLQSADAAACPRSPTVHVFGLSSLSPMYLNVLGALSLRRDVHFYQLNPCRHYWGDILSRRERLRAQDEGLPENDLLASLGSQGREFIDQLYSLPVQYEDHFDFVDITPSSLLRRVQRGILELEPDSDPAAVSDASIQVVNCYSELRELQVLHDRLLHWLEHDPQLHLDDIVVMCPDISKISPYIEAVFGLPGSASYLPYAISDHNILVDDPLVIAILEWIRLPASRLTVSEVLGWLELPAVQRALDIGLADLEQIRFWIDSNHIHWGADEQHKHTIHQSAGHLNSWRFGINRLLGAAIMSDDSRVFGRQAVAWEQPGQTGFQLLGRLQWFIDRLHELGVQFADAVDLQGWQQRITAMLDALCSADEQDERRLKAVRDALAELVEQAAIANFRETLDYRLLHALMLQSLQRGGSHQQYLSGVINFCNLIPMRSLPFRVVCLLGFDDESFPRRETAEQFDLIARFPRKGDRSRREDDRYMFLQSLMSAGERFYVSYVGRNKRDDSEIQPSVVLSEFLQHVEATTACRIDVEMSPLQPFSPVNFERGSYAAQWLAVPDSPAPAPFVAGLIQHSATDTIDIDNLTGFFTNPARFFMQNCLQLSLRESARSIKDEAEFTLDPLAAFALRQALQKELLSEGRIDLERHLLSGLFSEGHAGRLLLQPFVEEVETLVEALRAHVAYEGDLVHIVELALPGARLSGRIRSYSSTGLLDAIAAKMKGKRLVDFWIRHCLLCATGSASRAASFFLDKMDSPVTFRPIEADKASAYLAELVEMYRSGQARVLPFYPDIALEYVKKLDDGAHEIDAREHMRKQWIGDEYHTFSEAQDAYIQTSLKNARRPPGELFDDEFYALAQRVIRPILEHWESE